MIAQSKMSVPFGLQTLPWQECLARALEGDGNGEGALFLWDGEPALNGVITQAEFDLIKSQRTFDDFFRRAATLPKVLPGPVCIRAANCGQTLATMGRFRDFLPNTFSRSVVVLSALGGAGGSTPLSVNTVYSLTVTPPSPYDFILNSGVEWGDQIDFTTENIPASGADFRLLAPDLTVLKHYQLESSDRVRYFTAVWEGEPAAWNVRQS